MKWPSLPWLANSLGDRAVSIRLAWSLAIAAIIGSVTGFMLALVYAAVTGDADAILSHVVLNPFITIVYAIVGALVISRQPRNAIGWTFLAVGALFAVNIGAAAYEDLTVIMTGEPVSQGTKFAQWLDVWFWVPGAFLPVTFILLLFPDGRLLSPRWRVLFWCATLGMGMTVLALALHPGPIESWGTGLNPYGIATAADALALLLDFGGLLLGIGVVGAILAFITRFRRSRGIERKQLNWILYAVLLMVLGYIVSAIIWFAFPGRGWVMELAIAFSNLTILGVAVAAGVAILRYRLYDIDLIINRTLVYGALTISVALFYSVIVSTAGYFLQTDNNLTGLLLSSALVVILFRPLRANIQHGVDTLLGTALDEQPRPAVSGPDVVDPEIQKQATARPLHTNFPLVALAALLVGLALAFTWTRLAMPFANDRLPRDAFLTNITAAGVAVTPLEAGPAGLQEGDVVIGVNGRSLEAWLTDGPWTTAEGRWRIGNVVSYTVIRQGAEAEVSVTLASYPLAAILRLEWGTMIYYTLFLLIAAYVFFRRPQVVATRVLFLAAAAQFSAMPWSLGLQVTDFVNQTGLWLYQLTTIGGFMLALIADFHFALVFPRPAGIISKERWLLPLIYGLPYLLLALYLLFTRSQAVGPLDWMGRWGRFTAPHSAVFLSLTFVTVVWQYRRSSGVTRRQIRWLMLAALVVAGSIVLFYTLPPLFGGRALNANITGLISVLFPLAVAISILRHSLFDINTLLNRALVYTSLTAVIIILYLLAVGISGAVLRAQGNLFVALVATGLAAILFQPLRDRLQKTVNRFMYGERDEPFEVLARLGLRLENTLSPEMVYPNLVETVSQALKLPYVAVSVWRSGQLETVESYGKPVVDPIIYPMTYHGELVGQLLVARRAPDERFSPADERILRSIARQAGAAVHGVQLMADLQQSRQELVTAREEERRRLRRDLHDGLGPHLASQMLTIDAIDKLLARDPERARALLHDLKAQSKAAVQDIRRVVYDLRPPALDELGLVGALRESATRQSQNGLRVAVNAPPRLPPLPAAVEVAAFRIAQEAMTNVVRHAQASACTVQLKLDRVGEGAIFCIEVVDDGLGLSSDFHTGVGFQSIRERASELGGSCRIESAAGGGVYVAASFPLSSP